MNLENKQVKHHTYGTGRVVSVESGRITIRFTESDKQKKFCYPSSFEQYLEMCDREAQEFVLNDLQKLFDKLEAERIEKEQRLLEEAKLREEEKKTARKAKATTTKKTTAKTTKTTKKKASKTVKKDSPDEIDTSTTIETEEEVK